MRARENIVVSVFDIMPTYCEKAVEQFRDPRTFSEGEVRTEGGATKRRNRHSPYETQLGHLVYAMQMDLAALVVVSENDLIAIAEARNARVISTIARRFYQLDDFKGPD